MGAAVSSPRSVPRLLLRLLWLPLLWLPLILLVILLLAAGWAVSTEPGARFARPVQLRPSWGFAVGTVMDQATALSGRRSGRRAG